MEDFVTLSKQSLLYIAMFIYLFQPFWEKYLQLQLFPFVKNITDFPFG